MHLGVDEPGHHEQTAGIDGFGCRLRNGTADGDDLAIANRDVALSGSLGAHDCAVLDQQVHPAHCGIPAAACQVRPEVPIMERMIVTLVALLATLKPVSFPARPI